MRARCTAVEKKPSEIAPRWEGAGMYPSAAMLLLQGVVCCLITLDLCKKRNKIKEGVQGALIV